MRSTKAGPIAGGRELGFDDGVAAQAPLAEDELVDEATGFDGSGLVFAVVLGL